MKKRYGIALLAAAVPLLAWFTFHRSGIGEEKFRKVWSGRTFEAETQVDPLPAESAATPGYDVERVWSGQDDWEPALAVDRGTNRVYQLTTRFSGPKPCASCPLPAIVFRRSTDGGASWGSDQFLAVTAKRQADPEIEASGNGVLYAAFLNGWDLAFTKSSNSGKTWTKPLIVAGVRNPAGYADKPIVAVSADGVHVYIGFNAGDAYVFSSHNAGRTFSAPVRISHTGRTWFHTGGAVGPDRNVYFSTTDFGSDYQGDANIRFLKSTDLGKTWTVTLVDTSREQPECSSVPGCYFGFIGPSAAMAVDPAGKIMIAYHANNVAGTPQKMYVRTSFDGVHWTPRKQLSVGAATVNNAFPALAAGVSSGDFRVAWQDDRNGALTAWNTWVRRTRDGGMTWGPAVRLSNKPTGAPYKTSAGFAFPYGDYFEMAVAADGRNHFIWGEGASYNGPGGCWYTRGN